MLFAFLANVAILYNLLVLPATVLPTIDASNILASNSLVLVNNSPNESAPSRLNHSSLGMQITAQSAIILDKNSNLVLWQKNPLVARPIASISKLLTALVFLDHNPGWETEITIKNSDYRSGGRAYVYKGEIIKVKDLFNLSLVASSNSATVALARATGLNEADFVQAMNQKAIAIGMQQAQFTEPTGLAPENIATASDIVKLASTAFAKQEIKQATIQPEYSFTVVNNNRKDTVKSTDKLLASYLQIIAGKTGYLDEAGYCLVSEVKGNKGNNLLVAVLGSATDADRFQDLKALSQWAFDNYSWK